MPQLTRLTKYWFHALAAIDREMTAAESNGEPLSFAAWAATAPIAIDPDPQPARRVLAYVPPPLATSRYLNATA